MVLVLETHSPFIYSWGGGWLHKKRVIPGEGWGVVGIPVGVSLSISHSLSLCGESVKGNLSILVSIHGVDFFFHYAIEGNLANLNKKNIFFK